MEDAKDILWSLYQEEREFARHHESQRTQGASLVIGISAGLIAMVSLDGQVNLSDLPSSILLIALGLFGMIFTQKHYERTRLHLYRSYEYYHALDNLLADIDLNDLRERANKKNRQRFGWLARLKLSSLWMMLNGVIVVIGLTISIYSLLF